MILSKQLLCIHVFVHAVYSARASWLDENIVTIFHRDRRRRSKDGMQSHTCFLLSPRAQLWQCFECIYKWGCRLYNVLSQDRAWIPVTLTRYTSTSQKLFGQFLWNFVNRLLIFFPGGIIFFPDCCYLQKKVISIFFFSRTNAAEGGQYQKSPRPSKMLTKTPRGVLYTIPHDHSMSQRPKLGRYTKMLWSASVVRHVLMGTAPGDPVRWIEHIKLCSG